MDLFVSVSIGLLILTAWSIIFSGIVAVVLNHKGGKPQRDVGIWMVGAMSYGVLFIGLWWLLYFTVWFVKEIFK